VCFHFVIFVPFVAILKGFKWNHSKN